MTSRDAEVYGTNPGFCGRLWQRAFPLGFWSEFRVMLELAWPTILTTFFQFFLQTTSLIMCGHLSKTDLDGVALASSFINVAGICIGLGMSTACDTLFSQTYGSSNKKRVGMYLQRSLMVMYTVLAILWCLHLNIRPVLLWLQQDPEISARAAQYMLYFMPGLLFDYAFLVLSRYLQNQNVMYPPMVAAFAGNVFNIVSQYVALHVLHFSYLSSAVLQATSLFVMFSATLAYILISGVYEDTWDGFQMESLCDWWDFVRLAVPGIFLVGLEEWSFEVATIIAGTLGDVQLGAQSIIFQIETIAYMIPLGMSVAVNIRVGQQLGSENPVGAAQSYRVGVVMVVMAAVFLGGILATMKDILPKIFSTDAEVTQTASSILPILGVFLLADGIAATASGAIRGCGRQLQGAILLFFGYYMMGLPVGIPLALLTDLQVMGMWLGLVVGIVAEALAFVFVVVRLDWQQEVRLALVRAFGSERAAAVAATSSAKAKATATAKASSASPEVEDAGFRSADERAPLLAGGETVAFFSEAEACGVQPDGRLDRRRRGRQRKMRRRQPAAENFAGGRFFSRSLTVVREEEGGRDGGQQLSVSTAVYPSHRVLLLRLVTLVLLLLALVGSAALRVWTDAVMPSPGESNSTAAETSLTANSSTRVLY